MSLDRIDKVLVANRGEIACRVFRTCARLGIGTVAVYSEADRDARHVRLADEAYFVGAAPARESYLRGDRIIEIAKACGANAIHPGYGFLSENAEFAEACTREGILFVGPSAEVIRSMGSKSAAKTLMSEAGVPLIPGYHGDDQSDDRLAREAAAGGYPVMIKAVSGGGGKGMRIVRDATAFQDALDSCRRESQRSFGDDRVLVERYVERPRHIEIQVFGDQHGNYVHLFERDCSVQRRHQKVIEEAPASGLTPEQREDAGRTAIDAARAVAYVGAGTVEFILAPDGCFYFMEMNTRLQVEHPVTEMITNTDLVEWQLRVAANERLPKTQDELTISGHSIEARIYAEDPDRGFLPSVGRLIHFGTPEDSDHVRIETGVGSGDTITPHYDPMLAKLVVWDKDRSTALRRLTRALAATQVVGVASNIRFLARVVSHQAFASGRFDTSLIESHEAELVGEASPPSVDVRLTAALFAMLDDRGAAGSASSGIDPLSAPWYSLEGWRLNSEPRREILLASGGQQSSVMISGRSGAFAMELEGKAYRVEGKRLEDDHLEARIDGRRVVARAIPFGDAIHVFFRDEHVAFEVVDPLAQSGEQADVEGGLQAPMPGIVLSLAVEVGAKVRRGAPLLVLEAMKMEHTVKAPADGIVKRFLFAPGDQVAEGVELVDFEASERQ